METRRRVKETPKGNNRDVQQVDGVYTDCAIGGGMEGTTVKLLSQAPEKGQCL